MNKTTLKMIAIAAAVVWVSNRTPVRAYIGP